MSTVGMQSKIFFARSAREIILCPTSKNYMVPPLHACYYATNILTATCRMTDTLVLLIQCYSFFCAT